MNIEQKNGKENTESQGEIAKPGEASLGQLQDLQGYVDGRQNFLNNVRSKLQ